jgi:hypothetical protein
VACFVQLRIYLHWLIWQALAMNNKCQLRSPVAGRSCMRSLSVSLVICN